MRNLAIPDDVVELADNEGGFSITYRTRKCPCGKYQQLAIFVIVLLLAIGATVVGILFGLKKSIEVLVTCYLHFRITT